jgi:methyl-accepting chemotaxis protein
MGVSVKVSAEFLLSSLVSKKYLATIINGLTESNNRIVSESKQIASLSWQVTEESSRHAAVAEETSSALEEMSSIRIADIAHLNANQTRLRPKR